MHQPLGFGPSTLPLHCSAAHASVTTKILIPTVVGKTPRAAEGAAKRLIQAQLRSRVLKPYKVTFAMRRPLTLMKYWFKVLWRKNFMNMSKTERNSLKYRQWLKKREELEEEEWRREGRKEERKERRKEQRKEWKKDWRKSLDGYRGRKQTEKSNCTKVLSFSHLEI